MKTKKYYVCTTVTYRSYIEVEAANSNDALKTADKETIDGMNDEFQPIVDQFFYDPINFLDVETG